MSHKKNFQGKETFHRVNFLYQAADLCRLLPRSQGKKLMMIYGSHLTSVCRKTVSRVDASLKRTICKGCCSILVPGDTAIVRLSKKPESQVIWVCTMCGAYRGFNTRPGHRIWRDRPEAVIDKIDLNELKEVSASQCDKKHRELPKNIEPEPIPKKKKTDGPSKMLVDRDDEIVK